MPKPDSIDPETWRLMVRYGGDPYKPRIIRIEVLDNWSGREWTLPEFQSVLADAIERIPTEFRDAARVEFEGGDGESSAGHFTIYYQRLETAAEMEERAKEYLAYARSRQAEEKAIYDRLKLKFG